MFSVFASGEWFGDAPRFRAVRIAVPAIWALGFGIVLFYLLLLNLLPFSFNPCSCRTLIVGEKIFCPHGYEVWAAYFFSLSNNEGFFFSYIGRRSDIRIVHVHELGARARVVNFMERVCICSLNPLCGAVTPCKILRSFTAPVPPLHDPFKSARFGVVTCGKLWVSCLSVIQPFQISWPLVRRYSS
jgi:hypothetical protein